MSYERERTVINLNCLMRLATSEYSEIKTKIVEACRKMTTNETALKKQPTPCAQVKENEVNFIRKISKNIML